MRRWIFMAALSAAVLVAPLWAQRGGHGGMAGGGVHGASAAAHSGGGYGGGAYHGGYGYGHYGHYGHYSNNSGRVRVYTVYPWRYGYGYPYASWGAYGGLGWSDASDSSAAQAAPAYGYAPPDNTNSYIADLQQREIDRLDDEVSRLRAERESAAARNSAPQPQVPAKTVLVYRNHNVEEIENYAIVGQTLWVFTAQRARKIPIAELDMPATTYANDARGIDFRLPGK